MKSNTLLVILLVVVGIYSILMTITNSKLQEEIVERDIEIERIKMVSDTWEELFYSEIGFQPYECIDN